MSKEYTEKEAAKILAKSMHMAVKKAMGKNPVADVLDANMTREADPSTVPPEKESVMNKAAKPKKLQGFMAKRMDKLKNRKKA